MSKIDKIIQILSNIDGEILGLSESGVLYKYNADHTNGYTGENYPANWEPLLESPVVDNSACEVNELNKYDIPPVSCNTTTKEADDLFDDILRENNGFSPRMKSYADLHRKWRGDQND